MRESLHHRAVALLVLVCMSTQETGGAYPEFSTLSISSGVTCESLFNQEAFPQRAVAAWTTSAPRVSALVRRLSGQSKMKRSGSGSNQTKPDFTSHSGGYSDDPFVESRRAEIDWLPADRDSLTERLLGIDTGSHELISRLRELLRKSGPDYGLRGFTSRAGAYDELLLLMKKWGSPLASKCLLEVGPGPGLFLNALHKLGAHADGLETHPGFVRLGRDAGVSMIQGSLLNPPHRLNEHPYDITFSRDVLDALQVNAVIRGPDDRTAGFGALRQLARFTKMGGLSIHIAERGFPFTDADIRAAGFEILSHDDRKNSLVMRRVSAVGPISLPEMSAEPIKDGRSHILRVLGIGLFLFTMTAAASDGTGILLGLASTLAGGFMMMWLHQQIPQWNWLHHGARFLPNVFLSDSGSPGGSREPRSDTSEDPGIGSLLRELESALIAVQETGKAPLKKSFELAVQLDPQFANDFDVGELGRITPKRRLEFWAGVTRILLGRGRLLASLSVGKSVKVQTGTLDPTSVKPFPYLGSTIKVADVQWDRFWGGVGVSLFSYAVIDPARVRSIARQHFSEIADGSLIEKSTFAFYLRREMRRAGITADQYADLIATNYVRAEELQHAKAKNFAQLRLGRSSMHAMKNSEIADAIVKSGPFYSKLLADAGKKGSRVKGMIASGVIEFEGKLGGTIRAMEEFLAQNRPDLAYIMCLNFLFMKPFESGETRNKEAYVFLVDVLSSLLKFHFGFQFSRDLIAYVETPGQPPAVRALEMLKTVYGHEFYDDAERAKLLQSAIHEDTLNYGPVTPPQAMPILMAGKRRGWVGASIPYQERVGGASDVIRNLLAGKIYRDLSLEGANRLKAEVEALREEGALPHDLTLDLWPPAAEGQVLIARMEGGDAGLQLRLFVPTNFDFTRVEIKVDLERGFYPIHPLTPKEENLVRALMKQLEERKWSAAQVFNSGFDRLVIEQRENWLPEQVVFDRSGGVATIILDTKADQEPAVLEFLLAESVGWLRVGPMPYKKGWAKQAEMLEQQCLVTARTIAVLIRRWDWDKTLEVLRALEALSEASGSVQAPLSRIVESARALWQSRHLSERPMRPGDLRVLLQRLLRVYVNEFYRMALNFWPLVQDLYAMPVHFRGQSPDKPFMQRRILGAA